MMQIDHALDQLAPVTLEQLNAEAELLTRTDRKYLLDEHHARTVAQAMSSSARALEVAGTRRSAYRSVYFDTPDRLSYRLAAHGRRRRFKVRTREYLDTGETYLEVKTRGGRGETIKERIACAVPRDGQPLVEHLTRDAQVWVREMLWGMDLESRTLQTLLPVLTTEYSRATVLLPDGSRATFDTDLRWREPEGRQLGLPSHMILETKSAGDATPLDRALWRAGQRPRGLSKFATGVAALHPELPSNKWSRLLRGPFSVADRQGLAA